MKLAIIGGRDFTDWKKCIESFDYYFTDDEGLRVDEIISGGARGADSLAKKIVELYPNIEYTDFPADWDDITKLPCKIKYRNGKPYNALAGFNRNKDIIEASDMILAFWDGISPGTANSLSLAKKAKKNTIIIYY